MDTMTNSLATLATTARLYREHGYVVDPRTGDIIAHATEGSRMPPIRRDHLNRCPRVPYHRRMNQGAAEEPTGQYATVWGDRKHGYVSKVKLEHAESPRWIGVQLPPQARMKRRWK